MIRMPGPVLIRFGNWYNIGKEALCAGRCKDFISPGSRKTPRSCISGTGDSWLPFSEPESGVIRRRKLHFTDSRDISCGRSASREETVLW